MNTKYQFIDYMFKGAALSRLFTPEELDQLENAARLVLSGESDPERYQTISLAKAAELMSMPRHDFTVLWDEHKLPILKLGESKQSGVKVYLRDFLKMQEILKKNRKQESRPA